MKRAMAALFGTIAGLVMLLNFKTHAASVGNPPAATSTNNTDSGAAGSGLPSGSGSASSGAASSGTKTYTGDSVDTRWGPVQVQVTVTSGKLTKAEAIVYPTENPRDQEINSYAVPTLNQEAVAAGSAKIDMVSGATYTSTGYIQSLQSALDKAGL